jgi:mannosyltransferase OCH1-like enzyme
VRKNVEEWQILHPQWRVTLWNNTLVRQAFPDLIPILSKLGTMSWVANILRYHIIERYGGVYLDTDIVPLRSLEPLRKLGTFTVCENPTVKMVPHLANLSMSGCIIACNAVIAATKNHPALGHVIEVSMKNTLAHLKKRKKRYSTMISGPQPWTDSAKKHEVNILYANTFFPCRWQAKEKCIKSDFMDDQYVYAMHTWEKSWK